MLCLSTAAFTSRPAFRAASRLNDLTIKTLFSTSAQFRSDEKPRTRCAFYSSWVAAIFAAVALATVTKAQSLAEGAADDTTLRETGRRNGEPERKLLTDVERACSATADHFDPQRFDREMAAAFRGHGLDLDQLDPQEAGARLARLPLTPALAAAIDDWCRARRTDLDLPTWRRLADVARAADPDPWRNALRDQFERPPAEAVPALRARAAEVLAMEKQPLSSLLHLVRMLWEAGDHATATPVLHVAERRFPDDFWVCFEQGNLNTVGAPNPDPAEAVRYFAKAVALRPRSFAAHDSLGNALLDQKKVDEAIAEYQLAIKLKPDDADAHNALREALLLRGGNVEAIAALREANRIKPDAAAAASNLIVTAPDQGKANKPVGVHRQAIRIDPHAIDHFNRGRVWLSRNEYEKAIAEFDEAIRIGPSFAETYVDRGFAFSSKGNYDKAIADYDKAIQLDPQNVGAYNFRGWIRATCPDAVNRDGNRALESAIWACALSEWRDPYTLGTLAAAYAETSDFGAAVKSQTKAIRLLADEKQKNDFRDRLELYQAKKAYHQAKPR